MNTLQSHIKSYFKENKKLSKEDLVSMIKRDFPGWSDNTINIYLSRLKNEGKIYSPARGIYEIESNLIFQPKVSSSLKKIYSRISKNFPYIKFCVWDTSWLNDFMRHQPFKNFIVIEVEKDASETIFSFVSDYYKLVFLNPDAEIFERYINNLNQPIIVKNLVSEAPLMEISKTIIPTIEKLLIDMLIDTELFSAQQNELDFIIKIASEKFSLNKLKMKRYAIRRNRESKLDKLINISLA